MLNCHEPSTNPSDPAAVQKKPKRPAWLWAAAVVAGFAPVLLLAWVLGGVAPEPSEGAVRFVPASSPQPRARRPRDERRKPVMPVPMDLGKGKLGEPRFEDEKKAPKAPEVAKSSAEDAAGDDAEEPAEQEPPLAENAPPPAGDPGAFAAAGAGGAGALRAANPFGRSGFAGGAGFGGGGGGAAFAGGAAGSGGPAPGGAVNPPAAPKDGPAERLKRGVNAIGRMLGVGGSGGTGGTQKLDVAVPAGKAPSYGGTTGASNPYATQPGGTPAITGTGATSIGGSGVGQGTAATGAGTPTGNPGNVGGGGGGGPPPEEGGLITKAQAGALQDRMKLEAVLIRRTVTKPLVDQLAKVMTTYASQVEKAAKAMEKVKDVQDAMAHFAPGGPMPDEAIYKDLETFRYFVISGLDAGQAGEVRPGEAEPNYALKARLLETKALVASMGTCLEDFAAAFPLADKGKDTLKKATPKKNEDLPTYTMAEADRACVQKAEIALRRRAQAGIGFIPVAKSTMLVLSGKEEGKGGGKKGGLQKKYKELAKKGQGKKGDPAAKAAAKALIKALKSANAGVKGVLAAFRQPPWKPGPKDERIRNGAQGRADEVEKIADELAGYKLPPGDAATSLPLALNDTQAYLREAARGIGQELTYTLTTEGETTTKKIDPVSQLASAAQNGVGALWQMQMSESLTGQLRQQAGAEGR